MRICCHESAPRYNVCVSSQLALVEVEPEPLRRCPTCDRDKPVAGFPKKWARRCQDCYRDYMKFAQVKLKYGMTREEWMTLYDRQNGGCAICGGPGFAPNFLVVDHDHVTSRIRGLLCDPCNRGISLLKDRPDLLRSAAEYLD